MAAIALVVAEDFGSACVSAAQSGQAHGSQLKLAAMLPSSDATCHGISLRFRQMLQYHSCEHSLFPGGKTCTDVNEMIWSCQRTRETDKGKGQI